jgi:hypothetical protein
MLSLTYVSSAVTPFDEPDLVAMLDDFRQEPASDITGMLLYSDGNIIQTLEGPGASVDRAFRVISADPRHRGVIVVLREDIASRSFTGLSVRVLRPTEHDLDETVRRDLAPTGTGRERAESPGCAYQLLRAFCDTVCPTPARRCGVAAPGW